MNRELANELALLIHAYPQVSGREWVATALAVGAAYFDRDDLPAMVDARDLADTLRRGLTPR